MIKICVVIVSWNSWKDILECLPTLKNAKARNSDVKIVVVENGSTDDSPKILPKKLPESVKYIDTKKNLGYAGGANVGIRWSLEHGADYIFILNPDTVVDPGVFYELLKPFEKDDKVGITGSRIYYYGDKDLVWWSGAKLNLWFGKIVNEGFKKRDNDLTKSVTEADYIAGTAMLIKKEVFEKIGLFNESYFHTSEETDFCIRAKKAGFKLLVNPKAKVWHKIGISSGGEYGPAHMYYMDRNRLHLMKNHGYWIPVLSWFLVAPLLNRRFAAAVFRGKNFKSVIAYMRGIKDFALGRIGKKR